MPFTYQENTLTTSDKVTVGLGNTLTIDSDFEINFPGEYEKSGVFVEAHEVDTDTFIYKFLIDGKHIGYIPVEADEKDLSSKDAFGDLDLLILPATEKFAKRLESVETKNILPYGENASQVLAKAGCVDEPTAKKTFKQIDFEGEKTLFVHIG